jgi:rhodanese-related sulfurtransferase
MAGPAMVGVAAECAEERMSQGGVVPQVPAAEVPADAHLLDVREADEWAAGHVPGALHIPLGELGARYLEIDRTGALYVICRSGHRSADAARALAGAGWQAHNVADGMIGWHAAGRPMTSESGHPFVA